MRLQIAVAAVVAVVLVVVLVLRLLLAVVVVVAVVAEQEQFWLVEVLVLATMPAMDEEQLLAVVEDVCLEQIWSVEAEVWQWDDLWLAVELAYF